MTSLNLDEVFFYPRVYNIKLDKDIPKDAISVMRPSKFSNPFRLSDYNNNRDMVLDLYEKWVYSDDNKYLRDCIKAELHNKHLVCCCHPKKCHADILLQIANPRD